MATLRENVSNAIGKVVGSEDYKKVYQPKPAEEPRKAGPINPNAQVIKDTNSAVDKAQGYADGGKVRSFAHSAPRALQD